MSLCIGFTFQTWRLWPAFLYSLWEKRYCSSNTGIYVSLHVAFQHSPPLFSFPIKKQKPKKKTTQNSVHCPLKPTWLSLRKIICTCKTAGVCEWRKKRKRCVFWEIGEKVSMSQCPPLFCLLESPYLWLEDKACWAVPVCTGGKTPTHR